MQPLRIDQGASSSAGTAVASLGGGAAASTGADMTINTGNQLAAFTRYPLPLVRPRQDRRRATSIPPGAAIGGALDRGQGFGDQRRRHGKSPPARAQRGGARPVGG